MWCLRGDVGAKPQRDFCLLPGTYVVGRLGTEIELDDKSVSRKHAKFTLPTSASATSFVLDDLKSKFGTSLDGQKLAAGSSVKVTEGTVVTFGNHCSFRAQRLQHHLLLLGSSSRSKEAAATATSLGWSSTQQWRPSCSIAVCCEASAAAVTSGQAACALLKGLPFVKLSWLQAWAVRSKPADPAPVPEDHLAAVSMPSTSGQASSICDMKLQRQGLLSSFSLEWKQSVAQEHDDLREATRLAGTDTSTSVEARACNLQAVQVLPDEASGHGQSQPWTTPHDLLVAIATGSIGGLVHNAEPASTAQQLPLHSTPSQAQQVGNRRKRQQPVSDGDVSTKRSRQGNPAVPDSPPHALRPDPSSHALCAMPSSAWHPAPIPSAQAPHAASEGPRQPPEASIATTLTRSGFNKRRREQSSAAGAAAGGPTGAGDEVEDHAAPPAQRPRTQAATPATPVTCREDDDMGGQVVRSPEAALRQEPGLPQEDVPDQDVNVVYEPLIKQVQAISVRCVQTPLQPSNVGQNFKAFRKIWPQGHGEVRPKIGYAPAAYSDTAVDAEAFLRSEQERRSSNRAADELFNARLASKKPAASARGLVVKISSLQSFGFLAGGPFKSTMATANLEQLSTKTISELKQICRDQGKLVSGNKTTLLQRIVYEAAIPLKGHKSAVADTDLSKTLPDTAGPWLRKCVTTWGLQAPFNTSLEEEHWQHYYQERKALDHRYTEACKPYDDQEENNTTADDKNQPVASTWQEDFPLPKMGPVCSRPLDDNPEMELISMQEQIVKRLSSCLRGCKGLANRAELRKSIKGSFYFLGYWVFWEDCQQPRTIETTARLYAPSGTGMAIDLNYSWHFRMRSTWVEEFSSLHVGVRTKMHPAEPTSTAAMSTVYDMCIDEDTTVQKRSLTTKKNLEGICQALFGQPKTLSARKIFSLTLLAGTLGAYGDDCDWVFRLSRRRFKLAEGEESEDRSGDDADSGNDEILKKGKKRRAGRGPFGSLYAGSDGDCSDADHENACACM
ncbi:hypothetical protein WJX74_005349 [Apatococcus lobatus]|uniref:Uncharacterized protein n=1 Tax=Apatococcus lobatus TaxID=904363 RepID=A0AAW1SBI0_9CHLO